MNQSCNTLTLPRTTPLHVVDGSPSSNRVGTRRSSINAGSHLWWSFGGSVAIPQDFDRLFRGAGAFEIPLQAKLLARTSRYVAIVAAGLVVDGGIYRHEFVADAVISALMRLQLETDVPIISAVLTPQRFHEHEEHKRFFQEHFVVKGTEAAKACAATIANIDAARSLIA